MAATASGVELAPDGRVYGLVRIHHWCGNDPVQTHIARTICYSTAQQALALGPLGLRSGQVSVVLHPADSAFFRSSLLP